jgi:hypothetical protein
MRLNDRKGVLALVFGAMLHYLMKHPRLGANKDQRLMAINAKREAWYARYPGTHRLPRILKSNLVGADGWADLSGPAIKAANTRAATGFFRSMCHEYFDSGSPLDRVLCALAEDAAKFNDILYSGNVLLPDGAIAELRSVCVSYGENYQSLREMARHEGDLVAPVRPKVHKFQHVPMFAEIINPTNVQCYMEESQIGTTTKVWKRCVQSRYKKHAQRNVLLKRLTGLLIRCEI